MTNEYDTGDLDEWRYIMLSTGCSFVISGQAVSDVLKQFP